jgi:hydroxyacylglutathione hydrolase
LNAPILFSGDTLFVGTFSLNSEIDVSGGCGRFFEGTGKDMDIALNQKIANLPHNTHVYCGHEYTVNNLKFGHHVEPGNHDIQVSSYLRLNSKRCRRS